MYRIAQAKDDGSLSRLIEASKDKIKWTLSLDSFILKIISIPASKMIWVVGSEGEVFLVNTELAAVSNKYESIAEIIFSAVIHPKTSDLIVSTSEGIRILTLGGDVISLIDEDEWFEHLEISEDGNLLFVSAGKSLCVFVHKDGVFELMNRDESFDSTISDIVFNAGSFLVSNYGGVREYKSKDLINFNLFKWKTSLLNISWSPNKKYIATGTQENAIHFWPYPLQKGKDFLMGGYPSKVNLTLWSSDSKEFVVNGYDDVIIWDFSQGPPVGKKPRFFDCGNGKITDILYNDELLVAGNNKGIITYFFPANSHEPAKIHAVAGTITCLNLASDGIELYVGAADGKLYCF